MKTAQIHPALADIRAKRLKAIERWLDAISVEAYAHAETANWLTHGAPDALQPVLEKVARAAFALTEARRELGDAALEVEFSRSATAEEERTWTRDLWGFKLKPSERDALLRKAATR